MKEFYLYLHCKPESAGGDPFYVGKGCGYRGTDLTKRNKNHKLVTEKYGKENIQVFIFPRSSEKEALEDEVRWIFLLREIGLDLANISLGGEMGATGIIRSEETRKKCSIARTGIKLSEEHKAKLSAAHAGVKLSPAHLAARIAGQTGIKKKPHSQETKNKIANKLKGIPPSAETIAKIVQKTTGQKRTPEEREKISNSIKEWWKKRKEAELHGGD